MNIRPFTISDIEKCAPLYMQAYNRPPWNYSFSHEKTVKYLTEYAERSRFVGFALFEVDEIVGAMLGHSKTWWTNDILYIDELFVGPESRGKGYGKQLLDHTENYSREQGYEVITLMTNRHMPAFQFYNHVDYIYAEHFAFLFKPL